MSATPLPKDITSYDLLKTAAVILMIIDHIGVIFFPEQAWWRAVGRLSAPIWLFLIGYARSRDLSPRLWIGAALLVGFSCLITKTFFPLNILVSIIIIRLVLDKIIAFATKDTIHLIEIILAFILLVIPSYVIFDYGVLGILLAVFGYAIRHKGTARMSEKTASTIMMTTLITYVVLNSFGFEYNQVQIVFIAAGCTAIFYLLQNFRAQTFPKLTQALPSPLSALLKLGGRRTLEIYVIHLIGLRLLACYMGLAGFSILEWSWF